MKMKMMISFCVLSLVLWGDVSFAEPGIRITEPLDGSTVTPGQEITVTIEAVDGFVVERAVANIAGSNHNENITSLPANFTDRIALDAVGKIDVSVFGRDTDGNIGMDDVELIVEQTAELESLKIHQARYWFETDWDGNVDPDNAKHISVRGIYSDDVERRMFDEDLTFASSDHLVVSVDSEGVVKPHKLGEAVITVSSSEVSATVSVKVEKPRGIPPSETIPPTTEIDIQPPANEAGWNNSDITVTLTATDNEEGTGVKEINYSLLGTSLQDEIVPGDRAEIFFSKEGVTKLVYYALDNERNDEETHLVEIRLDKTPPQIDLQLNPLNFSEEQRKDKKHGHKKDKDKEDKGSWYELLYSATDSLSGLKTIEGGLVIIPITNYKIKLKQHHKLKIDIDEDDQEVKIKAPNPEQVLSQLQKGLLPFNSGQALQLKVKHGKGKWKIEENGKGIKIKAPSIIFKVKASDVAANTATEELKS